MALMSKAVIVKMKNTQIIGKFIYLTEFLQIIIS